MSYSGASQKCESQPSERCLLVRRRRRLTVSAEDGMAILAGAGAAERESVDGRIESALVESASWDVSCVAD